MEYKLLAADFDNTLSVRGQPVTERVRTAILRASAAGKLVTLATGRLFDGAKRAAALFPDDPPLILSNGGLLQRSDGTVLFEKTMERDTALEMMAFARRFPGAAIAWTRRGAFTDRFNAASDMYGQITGKEPQLLIPQEAAAEGVYKIILIALPETVDAARRELDSREEVPADYFPSGADSLEIVPPGVDKGSGLRRCAELLGIPLSETIAVGDGENDIPMLRAAGLGAAMGNAPERVKAAADIVVPPCDQDGAAWLIENYLL